MKNVRLYYRKTGRMKFVSHLDMNRFMIRSVRMAKLPIWYTEGFNPHPYVTFALPLPLGFTSDYEIVDIRLVDDSYDITSICEKLNSVCPQYVRFFDCRQPVLKTGAVAFAEHTVTFDDNANIYPLFKEFLNEKEIICSKKTKKGDIKEFDILPKIKKCEVKLENQNTVITVILPAGPNENINPDILINAFYEKYPEKYFCYEINRTAILDNELFPFR